MGLSFQLSGNAIRFTTVGDVEFNEGVRTLEAGFAAAAAASRQNSAQRWHLYFDIRQSTENRSSNDIQSIALLISDHKPILSGHCVVLTSNVLHYGLARMFGLYMESLGLQVSIFEQSAEADCWLESQK